MRWMNECLLRIAIVIRSNDTFPSKCGDFQEQCEIRSALPGPLSKSLLRTACFSPPCKPTPLATLSAHRYRPTTHRESARHFFVRELE